MSADEGRANGGRLRRLVPILDWGRRYNHAWLRGDVIAGLSVAALVVPKALGYAGIAGVPIENGLYAALAGAVLYALFGTSRQIATGPSSALAAVAGSAVIVSGVSNDADATALVAGVALVAGLLFLLMAVFKLGWISQFLSKAVITGFLFGAAIDVTVGELEKLTGTESSGENVWQEFASWVGGLNDGTLSWTTLFIGVISLVALFVLSSVAPKFPGTLIVVATGILVSIVFDLGAHGVELTGDVPRGLPTPGIPDLSLLWDNLATVSIAAVGIVLIGFSQTAGDARHFASKHRYRVDIDQETVAEGMSNVGAGLIQGIPVSTSLSASSASDVAGAKSQIASLSTGAVVLLTLLVLAPLFSDLPKAVLGAVIIEAVIKGMIDLPEMKRLRRVKPFDFWIAVAALLGVLTFGVLAGIVIGAILSVGWLVYVSTRPAMPVLSRIRGTHIFREYEAHPEDELIPGVVAVRLDGGLFFATADALGDRIRELSLDSKPPPAAIVLDCADISFIDSEGSAELGEIASLARENGIALRLARVKPAVIEILDRDGVLDTIGSDNIYDSVNQAAEAPFGDGPASRTEATAPAG